MITHFDQARVELDRALFLRIVDGAGTIVTCLEGRAGRLRGVFSRQPMRDQPPTQRRAMQDTRPMTGAGRTVQM